MKVENLVSVTEGKVVEKVDFNDHHKYKEKDYKTLKEKLRESGAESFITTEKDRIKLQENFISTNKIYYLVVEVKFLRGEEKFKQRILKMENG